MNVAGMNWLTIVGAIWFFIEIVVWALEARRSRRSRRANRKAIRIPAMATVYPRTRALIRPCSPNIQASS
jgi:hypothetical protein